MFNILSSETNNPFRQAISKELGNYLSEQSLRFKRENCLKIDLHCHDKNSDIPDELWGRILNLPETWLETKDLVKLLKSRQCDLVTITNHNNARSCWELIKNNEDVLPAAEFTCFFPEYDLFIHVLTYGFNQQQESELNNKRSNIYEFCRYAHQSNIPLILPHPLYFYTRNEKIDLTLFEKFAILFQRFEILNGQRDQWQSVLTLKWITSLTPEKIQQYAKRHNLNPHEFGVDPNQPKVLTGGSDDHMGIFAGQSGSYLYVDNLKEKLKNNSKAELALEAIRKGDIAPFGDVSENQKLNIAILDYFSQVATHMEDPGLLRILFHRGDTSDKLACFAISNLMLELKKRKSTRKFFDFIHKSLHGTKPSKLVKWKVGKDYRMCITLLENIAESRRSNSNQFFVDTVNQSLMSLFNHLNKLIIQRFKSSLARRDKHIKERPSTSSVSKKFDIPSQISQLISGSGSKEADISGLKIGDLLDNLSFPFLVSIILLGTTIGSTRLLYQNRRFLDEFSDYVGQAKHPKKALYLTDTLFDKNGVSNSLSGKLKHIQEHDLPVDFLICHPSIENQPHLHVVKPLEILNFPEFGEQDIRIPDLMEIMQIFYQGGYDRVVCSTEGPMAIVSLLIKHMFNIPAYFFMHTDWLEFIKDTTDLTKHERDRFRRLLRFFYQQYEGVFVLNDDHKNWLIGHEMQLDESKVIQTAHHIEPAPIVDCIKKNSLFKDARADTPVMLYVGRLSKEKGVFDLIDIYHKAKLTLPDLRLVIAGIGPAEKELKERMPSAKFLGWVTKTRLHQLYASLDIKVFPTRFDTFGNVILEAFSFGMPVISYNCKGPKSIIQNDKSGFLVNTSDEICERIILYFSGKCNRFEIRNACFDRAREYQAEPIMRHFLESFGIPYQVSNKKKEGQVDGSHKAVPSFSSDEPREVING